MKSVSAWRACAVVLVLAALSSAASGQSLGLTSRAQPIDTLWVVPRLAPSMPGAAPSGRPPPSDAPTLAIPGTNGRAAFGVEAPPSYAPGHRIIIAPGTISTPPRNVRGQGGTVPAFSITIPSR